MARTKRIYNKPEKWFLLRSFVKSKEQFIKEGWSYANLCMGNCPRCKDRKQDYKYKRKRERQELKFDFKEVLKK